MGEPVQLFTLSPATCTTALADGDRCSVCAAVHHPGPDVGLGRKSHPAWLRPPASLPRVPLLPLNSCVIWVGHLTSFVSKYLLSSFYMLGVADAALNKEAPVREVRVLMGRDRQ